MDIRNVSRTTRSVTPTDGPPFSVAPDETVEVPEALGKSLIQQPRNWQKVVETAPQEKE